MKQRLNEVRTYRAAPDACVAIPDQQYEILQGIDRQPDRIAPKVNKSRTRVEMADMAAMGRGGQGKLAEKWGLLLPPDYAAFCDVFKEYVLATRNSVHIHDCQIIEETTHNLRKGWHYPQNSPHQILYFAEIVELSGHFVFRWRPGRNTPEVLLAEDYGVIGEPGLLGGDGDLLVTDPSFSAWLTRMIETDGYPLMPGREEPEFDSLKRVK